MADVDRVAVSGYLHARAGEAGRNDFVSEAGIPTSARTAPTAGLAYDARYITARPTGIGQVCLELLRGLAALDDRPHLHLLVNRETQLPDELRHSPGLTIGEVPWSRVSTANQLLLPRYLKRHGIRLIHSVDGHNPLLAFGVRQVVNIHDLIPLTCPDSMPKNTKARFGWAWRTWLKLQCARASRVVCGSRHAMGDIVRLLGVDPARIAVIPNPIREWSHTDAPEQLRGQLGLAGRVISYVGRQMPYKNVITLIRALPMLNRWLGGTRLSLVIAGDQDARYPEPQQEVRRLGLDGQVVFPGYLSEASLGALYRLSDVFVFPSLYEGFGMPPLEAMRFGTPVIAGQHASLPEVLGDAALNVDTCNPHAVAQGVLAILRDPALAQSLRQAGYQHVRRYSRAEAARAYCRLYQMVLGDEPVPAGQAADVATVVLSKVAVDLPERPVPVLHDVPVR
jgi:alpha-1,3-rhamnosyl/mannosyltransferase